MDSTRVISLVLLLSITQFDDQCGVAKGCKIKESSIVSTYKIIKYFYDFCYFMLQFEFDKYIYIYSCDIPNFNIGTILARNFLHKLLFSLKGT